MATEIFFDRDQGFSIVKRSGKIASGEMIEGTRKLVSDPIFKEMKKSLTILQDVDFSDVSAAELEDYASFCENHIPDIQIAIVAPGDLEFGISRRFQMLFGVEKVFVSRDMDRAVDWLGIGLPE